MWLLGIGDRHPSNIILHNNGTIFHIDFGHILGNFKETNIGNIINIKREKTPFVFIYLMKYVIIDNNKFLFCLVIVFFLFFDLFFYFFFFWFVILFYWFVWFLFVFFELSSIYDLLIFFFFGLICC